MAPLAEHQAFASSSPMLFLPLNGYKTKLISVTSFNVSARACSKNGDSEGLHNEIYKDIGDGDSL